ncbi:MAG: gamma-glutamyltransferase [Pseudomonadota bacterium]
MLRAGGTAVDAAVAAAFAAFVVEPVLSGPLGAGVMAMADPGRAPVYLDGVPTTPRAKRSEADLDLETVTVDFGADTQDFHIGAATIAVPCLIPMLLSAQAQAGRVPLPDLLAPAIRHAREGHELSALQAKLVTLVAPILTADQGSRDLFMAEGALLGPGARFANPALGDVLDVLSHEGARFVTEGEIAALLRDLPGHHLGPLDRAAPAERAPLTVTRRGTAVSLNPSPSLGGLSIALALSALPPDPDPAEIARGFAEIDRGIAKAAVKLNHLGIAFWGNDQPGVDHPSIVNVALDERL